MLIAGIIISFFTGLSILNFISFRFSILEKAGLSFLIGIASQTFLMLMMDAFHIPVTPAAILSISLLLIVLMNFKTVKQWKNLQQGWKEKKFHIPPGINLVWLILIGLLIYLEYMNWEKCMFFPTFDRDSLAGFDTIGWIISQEYTLKGVSIFQGDYMEGLNAAGSYITYMPMVQLSYAYVYMLGAETSKIIPALIYLCLLISFYAACRRFCGDTGAALATLLMFVSPEMLGFSSLSGTNVIHAAYASLGVIYTVLWLKTDRKDFFILAILLMAFNLWVRNEGIVFTGAAIIIIFLSKWKSKEFKDLIIYTCLTISPLILWSLFMKIYGIYAENIFIFKPFIDTEKMSLIFTHFKMLIFHPIFYGLSFKIFFIIILLNLYYIIKRKDMLHLLGIIFLSLLFYGVVLYQIEYKWDSIENVLNYSAKRFFFCFIPLLSVYTVSNHLAVLLLGKLEKALSFSKEKISTK